MPTPLPMTNTREAITRLLFVQDTPRPVDLVMVLGCPSLSNMDPAIALYQSGMTPRILISGKGADPEPEWLRYQRHALARGIPESALLVETESMNTRENFEFSARLLARTPGWENLHALAIVAKPFHGRRALMTARRHFPAHLDILITPPRSPEDIQAGDWWQTPRGRQRVMEELRRIGEYALRDHLGDF